MAEEEKRGSEQALEGTGRGGSVTKGDVLNFVKGGGSRLEERVKMTRLRSRVAERMKEAQNTAAILTSFNEVDLKAVMDLRRKYQEQFIAQHGIKLGLMSFFVKACCDALRKHPVVNASIEGDEIVYHNYQDIGIAVSTERGLMVPVIRNAENMGLAEIEQAIAILPRRPAMARYAGRPAGRHFLHHQWRRVRIAGFHPAAESAAKRHTGHAYDQGTPGGRGR